MADMQQRIKKALQGRFPKASIAVQHYGELLTGYVNSGLNPPHILSEIETGEEGKFWSCIWEAFLYRHLHFMGYQLTNSVKKDGQLGPDFCFDHRGKKIWIEAAVPSPDGVPCEYLQSPQIGENLVKTKPDQERVLRCTSVISDKKKKFDSYQTKGIVGPGDCTVIALNICRLSSWDFDGTGVSGQPLIMEAVLPVGPLVIPIGQDGKIDGPAQNIPRYTIKKVNDSGVTTANFLTPLFANVSAVMQAHQRDTHEKQLILSVVHNPYARNPLPIGLFGADREYVVSRQEGEEYFIENVAIRG